MGTELMTFYREKVKKSWKIAFLSVMILGLLTHLYKFTNYLPDRDSLLNVYHDQNIVASGRWLLSLSCGISSYFDLPMVIGVLSLCYIALTMVVITELFHMENPVLIVLSSGILVTFPGVTETFLYEYTADGYMLAMLLSAVSVYLTRMRERISWKAYLAGGICLCMCCGIYQAYVSFALVLILCHYMQELLENRWEWKVYFRWAVKQLVMFAAAMAAYYAIWKVSMELQQMEANSYQGISEIGTNVLDTFLGGFAASVKAVAAFFVQWNFLKFGFTPYSVLNILFLVFCGGILVAAPIRAGLIRRKPQMALYCLSLLLIIPCSCIWAFVSRSVLYRPMMLMCFAVLYLFTLVLFERWAAHRWANLAALLLAVTAFNFSLMANISYHYLNKCYERTYAIGIQMMLDMEEMKDEYSFEKMAVVGDAWLEDTLVTYDRETQRQTPASGVDVISRYMYNDLMYDHFRITTFLTEFIGVDLETASWTEALALEKDPAVQEMPVWPAEGSLRVIGDTLVIKIH
nr:glucosyltransferase domain-containing protein [Oscillospiraceae bacterium]